MHAGLTPPGAHLIRNSGRVYMPLPPVGAIAQLGERLNGIQEVSGSIPLGSTNSRTAADAIPPAGAPLPPSNPSSSAFI